MQHVQATGEALPELRELVSIHEPQGVERAAPRPQRLCSVWGVRSGAAVSGEHQAGGGCPVGPDSEPSRAQGHEAPSTQATSGGSVLRPCA
eukprot:SAG31_NODE_15527_length_750_cov_1.165899_2_plen_90_part_01